MTNPNEETPGGFSGNLAPAPPTMGIAKIMQLMLSLQTTIAQLQQGQAVAQPPALPPAMIPVAIIAPPPVLAYIPPIMVNPTASVYPSTSLLSQFPTIEVATITSIIQHNLQATELFKLDSCYCDKSDWQILVFNGTALEVLSHDSVTKEYKTLNSVSVPLATYFSILLTAIAHSEPRAVSQYFLWYMAHLLCLEGNYKWPVLLLYHTDFFNKRQCEMSEGIYTGWSCLDHDLDDNHLHGHQKHTPVAKQSTASSGSTS